MAPVAPPIPTPMHDNIQQLEPEQTQPPERARAATEAFKTGPFHIETAAKASGEESTGVASRRHGWSFFGKVGGAKSDTGA